VSEVLPSAPSSPGSAVPTRAVLIVVGASTAFAMSSPIARLASPAHPLLIAAGRLVVASLILGLADAPGLIRSWKRLSRRQLGVTLFAGLLLAAHFALFQWGLVTTSLPAAVSLVSLEPLAVIVVASVVFGIFPRRAEQIGILTATVGAVVLGSQADKGEHRVLGDLCIVGSVVIYGGYVACARGLRDALPARHYTPIVYGAAAIVTMAALPFVHDTGDATLHGLAMKSWGYIVLLGLIPTAVGHTLVQLGARTLSPSVIALVSPGETLGSLLLLALAFGAHLSGIEAIGALAILAGAGVTLFAQRRTSSA
jgi:drug/metabolite transporter (DMT)-like permease